MIRYTDLGTEMFQNTVKTTITFLQHVRTACMHAPSLCDKITRVRD